MSDATVCLLVLAVTVALFIWNQLPVEVVALGSALALYATGLLDAGQVFAGFGDPVIGFVAALFIVAEALGVAGVTAWAGQQLITRAGTAPRRLLLAATLLAAALTPLISVNGMVAALLPMVVLLAVRLGRSPSTLAMPLAFAGHAASLLVLTATPINLLVSEAADLATGSPFGFFEYAGAGLPLLAGTIAILVLASPRLLPVRSPKSLPADLSSHSRTLIDHYQLDADATAMRIPAGTPASGQPLAALTGTGLDVVGAVAPDRTTVRDPRQPLRPNDIIVVRGGDTALAEFAGTWRLEPQPRDATGKLARLLVNRDLGVAELVVRPRSALVGDTVYPGMSTDSGELVILAVARDGRTLPPDPVRLRPADMLLVRGTWAALSRQTSTDPGVLVVDAPASVRRQTAQLGRPAWIAITVTALMIAAMASGVVPAAVAALVAAGAMVVLRVLTVPQAYAGISWTTLVIVAGMIPMSLAMQSSGAAGLLADLVVSVFGAEPRLLLAGLFLLTATLGQVISNTATALIVIPIATGAAAEVGVSVRPVLLCVAVAAAAALLTPIATAANLMVKQPGGYRFGDYARLGLPILAWFAVIAILWVPVVWPL